MLYLGGGEGRRRDRRHRVDPQEALQLKHSTACDTAR